MNNTTIYSEIDRFIQATGVLNEIKSRTHRAVLECISQNPKANVSQIQKHIGLPQSSVSGALADLKKAGLVVEEAKSGKSRFYKIAETNHRDWIDWIDSVIKTIPVSAI